jgi:hypothetical protein
MKTRMLGARGGMLRQRTWSCCQPRSESWFARCDDSRHALETGTARCGPPRSCSRAMVSIEACARSKTVDCAVHLWASSSMGFGGCVSPRTPVWIVPPSRCSCIHIYTSTQCYSCAGSKLVTHPRSRRSSRGGMWRSLASTRVRSID